MEFLNLGTMGFGDRVIFVGLLLCTLEHLAASWLPASSDNQMCLQHRLMFSDGKISPSPERLPSSVLTRPGRSDPRLHKTLQPQQATSQSLFLQMSPWEISALFGSLDGY